MTQSKIYGNYVGWVPCLNGQLVFDLVECGLKNGNSIEIVHYAKDKKGRLTEYIILHSTVDWKDFDDEKKELKGIWSIVLLSKRSVDGSSHTGTIYFMLNENKGDEPWRESIEAACEINVQLNTEQPIDIPKKFLDLESSINKTCKISSGCYKSEFVLEQDGVVWVTPLCEDDNDGKIIARQSYYYIKYSWHVHQHHDSRAETLTTVHKVNSDNPELYVANRLIGDLKRNLVKFKREIDHTSHREIFIAKGIVSYAKALVEIMKSKEFINDDSYNKEINHLRYFQESLDITSSKIEKDMALHSQAVGDARAIILFMFAMITPAILANKINIIRPLPDYIEWITSWYSSGVSFIVLILIIVFVLFLYVSVNSHFGNFWILWVGFKKSISCIVKDDNPDAFLSNSNVLSITIIFIGLCVLISGIYRFI